MSIGSKIASDVKRADTRIRSNGKELFSGKNDIGENAAIIGSQLGVPLKSAAMLRQSTNDLLLVMTGSDAEIVRYYQNYDSAEQKAGNEMSSMYSIGNAIDTKDESLRAEEKDRNKEEKKKAKDKAAARSAQADSVVEKLTGFSGMTKDSYGI